MGITVRERPKDSGVYWVFINHNGRRKAKKVGDKKTAVAVAKRVQETIVNGDLGILVKNKIPLLKECADKWLATYVQASCKPATYRLYEMLLRVHLLPVFGIRAIDDISLADVKDLVFKKVNENLATSTIMNIRACLSGIYTNAIEDGFKVVNPAARIGKFINRLRKKDQNKRINFYTKEEAMLFLNAIQKYFPTYYPLFMCSLRTGMRIGEVLALTWQDVDFDRRVIEVNKTLSEGEIVPPKSGKPRSVDMSMQLTDTLKVLRTARKREALQKGNSDIPDIIFTSENGTHLDRENVRKRIFYKCLETAGLRKIRLHDLRHTYASLMIAQGTFLVYIKEQMGHSSIKVTIDLYGHLVPGAHKAEVDKLDDWTATCRNLSATRAFSATKKHSTLPLSA
jgi:integrase